MALELVADERMSDNRRYSIEAQIALIKRDIADIRNILDGDGRGKRGLIQEVEDLTEVSDRGRWSLKIGLWIGGAIVGLLTIAAQLKGLIFGSTPPPGH